MKILFLGYQKNSIIDFYKSKNYDLCITSDKLTFEQIRDFEPEWIISYGYQHIIKKNIVDEYKDRILNLHISFLPWNGGVSPNLWSVVTNTKKGVTIHFLDEGIDTGDILFQEEVFFDNTKTLQDSYNLLRNKIEKLFIDNWENIMYNNYKRMKQSTNLGSYHSKKQTRQLMEKLNITEWSISIGDVLGRIKNDR